MQFGDIRVVLMILAVVGIVYFLYKHENDSGVVPNSGVVSHDTRAHDDDNDTLVDDESDDESYDATNVEPDADLDRKLNQRRNSSRGGQSRTASYSEGDRPQNGSWEGLFDAGNSVIPSDDTNQNNFVPMGTNSSPYAPYQGSGDTSCNAGGKCDPEDLFNADKMLPQEVNDDWFEVTPDPVSVKNRHLINVTRPIGVNTIGSSTKNASYDIRGTIPNPRTVVSPFLNSSIEPDFNIKPNFC